MRVSATETLCFRQLVAGGAGYREVRPALTRDETHGFTQLMAHCCQSVAGAGLGPRSARPGGTKLAEVVAIHCGGSLNTVGVILLCVVFFQFSIYCV